MNNAKTRIIISDRRLAVVNRYKHTYIVYVINKQCLIRPVDRCSLYNRTFYFYYKKSDKPTRHETLSGKAYFEQKKKKTGDVQTP